MRELRTLGRGTTTQQEGPSLAKRSCCSVGDRGPRGSPHTRASLSGQGLGNAFPCDTRAGVSPALGLGFIDRGLC